MRDKHQSVFEQFLSTFAVKRVQEWEKAILAWKEDKSKPNPYKEPVSCTCC